MRFTFMSSDIVVGYKFFLFIFIAFWGSQGVVHSQVEQQEKMDIKSLIKWDEDNLRFTKHGNPVSISFLIKAKSYQVVSDHEFIIDNSYVLRARSIKMGKSSVTKSVKKYEKSVSKRAKKMNNAQIVESPDLGINGILSSYTMTYVDDIYGPSEAYTLLFNQPFENEFFELQFVFRQQNDRSWNDRAIESVLYSLRYHSRPVGLEAQQWQARRNMGESLEVFDKNGMFVSPSNQYFKLLSYEEDNLLWHFSDPDSISLIPCYIYEYHGSYSSDDEVMQATINKWVRTVYQNELINSSIEFNKTHRIDDIWRSNKLRNKNNRYHLINCGDKVIALLLRCNRCDCSDDIDKFERHARNYSCPRGYRVN